MKALLSGLFSCALLSLPAVAQGGKVFRIESARFAGAEVSAGALRFEYWSRSWIDTVQAGVATGEISTAEWDTQGNQGATPVVVSYERQAGETPEAAAATWSALVQAALAQWPPVGGPPASGGLIPIGGLTPGDDTETVPATGGEGSSGGDVMSASWEHDLDGAGWQPPIEINVSVEKRSGESTGQWGSRFKKAVAEAVDLYPPNVPENV